MVSTLPYEKKSEAHETLSLLLKRDGAPTNLVSDGAKEETLGEFRRKAREADIHCKETDPHSPWQIVPKDASAKSNELQDEQC
jgi:hypothetical protein